MSFRDLTTAAVFVLLVWTTNAFGGECDVVFQDGFEDPSNPVEKLVLVEQYVDGKDGVTGLDVGNHSLSLSPDGCHLYAAGGHFAFSDQPNRGALVVFDRNDVDGRLTHLQSLIHGENVSLMVAASDTAVSPDGRHVYVAANTTSFFGGRYLVFDRAADGLLTERVAYNGGWLNRAIEISPDGNSVYIGGGHGLLSLARAADGTLSSISGSEEPGAFDVDDITMSQDGTSLYTAGSRCPTGSGNCFPLIYGVVPMTRDTTTGALVAGMPIERSELAGTRRLELSRDGRYLFASGAGITVFQRAEDGTLTFLSHLAGVGAGNVDKLPLSSDGQRLFANGELVDTSDPTSLSVVDDIVDEVGFGASGHTADPGFRHLYSIGWDSSSETYILSLFHLEGR